MGEEKTRCSFGGQCGAGGAEAGGWRAVREASIYRINLLN